MLRESKQSLPRLGLAEPPYDDETAAALSALGPPLALFRLLARRPARARAVQAWGRYYFSRASALSLRHRELVIDRTTVRCGAHYEWGVHVAAYADRVQLTADQIGSVVHGGADDPCWTDPTDRAVLRAVDALHDRNDLGDAEFTDLIDAVGEDGAVDLMLVCGWYHAISYVARVARLSSEPGSPGFPPPVGAVDTTTPAGRPATSRVPPPAS